MAQMTNRCFEHALPGMNSGLVPSELVFYDRLNEVLRMGGSRGRIAMFIDGACRGNGQPGARAAYGVFSGQDSPLNSYGLLPGRTIHTNNKAEIFAAHKAVDIILNDMGWQGWKDGAVLITDSDYLFQSITSYIDTWMMNGFLTSTGGPVVNAEAIALLHYKICYLDSWGINVRFWRVDRVHNQDADRLANFALGPRRREEALTVDVGYCELE